MTEHEFLKVHAGECSSRDLHVESLARHQRFPLEVSDFTQIKISIQQPRVLLLELLVELLSKSFVNQMESLWGICFGAHLLEVVGLDKQQNAADNRADLLVASHYMAMATLAELRVIQVIGHIGHDCRMVVLAVAVFVAAGPSRVHEAIVRFASPIVAHGLQIAYRSEALASRCLVPVVLRQRL